MQRGLQSGQGFWGVLATWALLSMELVKMAHVSRMLTKEMSIMENVWYPNTQFLFPEPAGNADSLWAGHRVISLFPSPSPSSTLPTPSCSRGDKLMICALSAVKCSKISAKFFFKSIHQRTKQFFGSVPALENGGVSQVPGRGASSYLSPWGLGPHLPLLMVINVEEYVWLNSAIGLKRITDQLGSLLPNNKIKYHMFFSELPS